ncbi:GspE/PulE family protein [Geothrix sp. 21YS21S-4]|uniref:GspE/PulE family protein n=1 Tax=Geothrix sp. 21YS21S-4 TaxID=3068889 RepID=UPI0027BADAF8|nr:GspE/PulE family protein [Geothrix sp. 21YS21S-4]
MEWVALPDPFDFETRTNLRVWRPAAKQIFYDFPPQAAGTIAVSLGEQAGGGLSSPVVDWLDESLAEGVRLGASDLHFVREQGIMVLRYRIHGRFRPGPAVPAAFQEALIPRLKVMSGLDVAEERLPQDGSFERRLSGYRHDFRVSLLPGVEGEGAVLRILGGTTRQDAGLSLDEMGMPPILLAQLRGWAQRRAGIVLITGPTGSGKTTTLYSLLQELDRSQLKIVTLEDPVEYALEGAHQVQVNPEIGLTFAQGLRAILRHDPDVILVGEIRDRETAEIALRASLTGHLVLSTLHTNSAVGAFTRLHDMGIPAYLTADAVLGVLAQRLLGRTCRACGASDSACPICRGGGVDGRLAIFEGGPAEPLRTLVRGQASEEELSACLRDRGYPLLIHEAHRAVEEGRVPAFELRAAGLGT